MLQSSRPGGQLLQVLSIGTGLLGSLLVAVLPAWRLGVTEWEAVLCSGQVLIWMLGWWLASKSRERHGPSSVVSALGICHTVLRVFNYSRVAFVIKDAPAGYAAAFTGQSAFAYTVFGLYSAESMFQQITLNRLLPSWLCGFIGCLQAFLWFSLIHRYTKAEDLTAWNMTCMILAPQLANFAPYHLTRWWAQRTMHHPGAQLAKKLCRSAKEDSGVSSADCKQADQHCHANSHAPSCAAAEGHTATPGSSEVTAAQRSATNLCTAFAQKAHLYAHSGTARSTSQSGAARSPAAAPPGAATASAGVDAAALDSVHKAARRVQLEAVVKAMQHAPYSSRLRASHTVCVKLDTRVPCSRLPPHMAQQLKSALCSSIGQATSLSINDVAVRPGCICITMKIEELLAHGVDSPSASSITPEDMAEVLLPELQGMLATGRGGHAFQQAAVQLDGQRVVCKWNTVSQTWDLQAGAMPAPEPTDETLPQLGAAVVTGLKSCPMPSSSSVAAPAHGWLDVLVEVQLWGVSKAADVNGWVQPEQHQPRNNTEPEWMSLQQAAGCGTSLELLAHLAGNYLPTQVLRLVWGSTAGCITAQVLIRVHKRQLMRHHVGGTPSALLLIDLELWQNEVLLSSSALVGVPVTQDMTVACAAWWWGAADSTVAAAMSELQELAETCMYAAALPAAPAAVHTYVTFSKDLTLWLGQIQRAACCSGLCHCGPVGGSMSAEDALLHQPAMDMPLLQQLGSDLMSYAQQSDWKKLHGMVSEQLRTVVLPAAAVLSRNNKPTSRWVSCSETVRVLLLGYPCHHDERLYKQQLAVHLDGVLRISSCATSVIATLWTIRSLLTSTLMRVVLGASWGSLHAAALVVLMRARAHAAGPSHMQHNNSQWAFTFTMLAYVWRNVVHVGLGLLTRPAPTELFVQAFRRPRFWATIQLVFMMTEQVPASVVLPAWTSFCASLLLAFPGVLHAAIIYGGLHPAPAIITSLMLVVVPRLVVDAHLRKHLRTLLPVRCAVRGLPEPHSHHAKVD